MYSHLNSCLNDVHGLADHISETQLDSPTQTESHWALYDWLAVGCAVAIVLMGTVAARAKVSVPSPEDLSSHSLQMQAVAASIDCTWTCLD